MPTPTTTPPEGFRARVIASLERRKVLQQHAYRTDPDHRRRVVIGSLVAGLVLLGLALLVQALVGTVDGFGVLGGLLTIVVVRAAMMRPPQAPHAHDLPGVEPPAECVDQPVDVDRWVLATRWGGGVVALLVAVAPGWVAFVAALVLAVVAAPVVRAMIEVRTARRQIAHALRALGPRWALTYGGYVGGPTHMTMWDPYLRASGDQGVVFNLRSRYCLNLRTNAALPLPWVQLGSDTLGDLQVLTVPSLKTFFHVHNAPIHLRVFGIRRVTHVWLGHGDSDKPGSRHQRHRNFDLLVVSGQAAIDRYTTHGVDIPREKFVILGRPQVGDIETAERPITEIARPRVLYAPTWVGRYAELNFSSIELGVPIVQALIDAGCDVVFRPHPVFFRLSKGALIEPIHQALHADTKDPHTPGKHLWGNTPNRDWSIFDCMNNTDVLLSDVSSVVSDWLQSTKPYAMLAMRHTVERFPVEIPVAQASYVVAGDLSNLAPQLQTMLHEDPLAPERARLKERVLGPFEGHESAEAFAQFVRDLGRGVDPRDDPAAHGR